METLRHMIHKAVEEGTWKGIRPARGSKMISHLFFANDLILFGEASVQQASSIEKVLRVFYGFFGQKINTTKSKLFVSKNVRRSFATTLSKNFGIPLSHSLGTYLGVPLFHNRVSGKMISFILEKVHQRLNGWKAKTLSKAAKAVLIQTTAAAILFYTMQTTKIPTSVVDELELLNGNFLWGGDGDCRKLHTLAWKTVCKPKGLGGLGAATKGDQPGISN